MTPRTAAIVLAAGSASRFGGGKLQVRIDGRPVLQHVLDAVAEAGLPDAILVVGPDHHALLDDLDLRAARVVVNPDPARGLSSSLHVGWRAAMGDPDAGAAGSDGPDAALIVLGDQPLIEADVLRAIAAMPLDASRPFVAAAHEDGSRHPVRIEASAASLVAGTRGDRGLGPLLDRDPARVRVVPVAGASPDLDLPGDLATVLAARWRRRVRDNAAQVERIREASDGHDFYASVSRMFVADPDRTDDPVLDALLELAEPTATWLDVGAGAGRYALPLARRVREVVAVDPSPSMLDGLREGMRAPRIDNVRPIEGRWPPDTALRRDLGPDPIADVALIAHVGYDVEDIGPFVAALERAARRTCVAILMDQSPAAVAEPFWPLVHGEVRAALPALPLFEELLAARGRDPNIRWLTAERRAWRDRDELRTFLRRQLWVRPGSAADRRLDEAMAALVRTGPDGEVRITTAPELRIGLATWAPAAAR